MRISSNDSVVFLMGPTASGKTELALEIFDRFDVSLISVDSALIYRGMDIGTAKPSPETLENYPHETDRYLRTRREFFSQSLCQSCKRAYKLSAERK